MQKPHTPVQYALDLVLVTLGGALMAFAVNYFFSAQNIVPGGVTGIAMMLNYLWTEIPIGAAILVINLPLFVLSWRFAGRRFLLYTVYGTLISSLFIDLTAHWPGGDMEPLLAAVFGGLVMGLGLGLVFTRGATTGGSDVAARLLKLVLPGMQMGQLMLAVDLVVIAASGFIFGDLKKTLYAVVTLYMSTQTTDAILYGLKTARVAYVITQKAEDVVWAIGTSLGRGATLLHGEGAYTGTPAKIILCAVGRMQIARLKQTVKDVDPDAFVILSEAHEVLGAGFRDYDKNAL